MFADPILLFNIASALLVAVMLVWLAVWSWRRSDATSTQRLSGVPPERSQLDRFVQFGRWAWQTDVSLLEGETRQLEATVFHIHGIGFSTGSLVLTNKRFFFKPHRDRYLPPAFTRLREVELWLDEISALGKRRWFRGFWIGFPGCWPFTVEAKDGSVHTFQALLSSGMLQREIRKAAGLEP